MTRIVCLYLYQKGEIMKIEEIKLKWLEISLNELGRHEEFESLDLDDLKNIANMGIDDLRDKYISKKIKEHCMYIE